MENNRIPKNYENNYKRYNIHVIYVMGIPEEGREEIEATMTKKILKLMSDTKLQIQKTQRTQSRKTVTNKQKNYT